MAMITDEGQKMMSLLCYACNDIFAIPARRGRPPKYCTKCTTGGQAKANEDIEDEQDNRRRQEMANERVDRLEMMLKSRGTHLSQQPEHWTESRIPKQRIPNG